MAYWLKNKECNSFPRYRNPFIKISRLPPLHLVPGTVYSLFSCVEGHGRFESIAPCRLVQARSVPCRLSD
ncbi:hypothetical protein FOXB_07887 [Fusarium oxysporum f. sp. conglutinans Fo5176]|uniref:Uncharacterized protein n=1 Tax=Fusarium oxysporum (strain Fo5176) TaxID=660025 RepID=F9FNA7_FUSOF|nr:hypothetical protein FOXB_07887 [Fusarium oxysporum f. sp. conglutinans Fo5176]